MTEEEFKQAAFDLALIAEHLGAYGEGFTADIGGSFKRLKELSREVKKYLIHEVQQEATDE